MTLGTTSTTTVAGELHDDLRDDAALLERTLRPYAGKNTLYLRNAQAGTVGGLTTGTGEFSIPEPCYIDDTGHFNAAEFVICYNQLLYYTLAAAVRDNLQPEFEHWTMQDYWVRQLPDVLIHRLDSKFSRPLNSADFRGEFVILSATPRDSSKQMLMLDTEIRFFDDQGGRCSGRIGIALIEPPVPA